MLAAGRRWAAVGGPAVFGGLRGIKPTDAVIVGMYQQFVDRWRTPPGAESHRAGERGVGRSCRAVTRPCGRGPA
ncbi:MAG: hypothetical protein WKF75_07050 [Singulisphaera sp.]